MKVIKQNSILRIFILFFSKTKKQKKSSTNKCWGFKKGDDLLSHNVVPSALMGLTSLFGMVRGEPHRYNHLKSFGVRRLLYLTVYSDILKNNSWKFICTLKKNRRTISLWVISTTRLWHYCLYTYSLSTWSSPTTL